MKKIVLWLTVGITIPYWGPVFFNMLAFWIALIVGIYLFIPKDKILDSIGSIAVIAILSWAVHVTSFLVFDEYAYYCTYLADWSRTVLNPLWRFWV